MSFTLPRLPGPSQASSSSSSSSTPWGYTPRFAIPFSQQQNQQRVGIKGPLFPFSSQPQQQQQSSSQCVPPLVKSHSQQLLTSSSSSSSSQGQAQSHSQPMVLNWGSSSQVQSQSSSSKGSGQLHTRSHHHSKSKKSLKRLSSSQSQCKRHQSSSLPFLPKKLQWSSSQIPSKRVKPSSQQQQQEPASSEDSQETNFCPSQASSQSQSFSVSSQSSSVHVVPPPPAPEEPEPPQDKQHQPLFNRDSGANWLINSDGTVNLDRLFRRPSSSSSFRSSIPPPLGKRKEVRYRDKVIKGIQKQIRIMLNQVMDSDHLLHLVQGRVVTQRNMLMYAPFLPANRIVRPPKKAKEIKKEKPTTPSSPKLKPHIPTRPTPLPIPLPKEETTDEVVIVQSTLNVVQATSSYENHSCTLLSDIPIKLETFTQEEILEHQSAVFGTKRKHAEDEDDVKDVKPLVIKPYLPKLPKHLMYVKFEKKHQTEKYTMLIQLMSKIYSMAMNGQTCTIRDLFYENMSIYKTQKRLEDSLYHLCHVLKVPRDALGIEATGKGMMAGSLTYTTGSGDVIKVGDHAGGMLIPSVYTLDEMTNIQSDAKQIIVVEKDAIFQRFVGEGLVKLTSSILITGKGYPDIVTLKMIRKLRDILKLRVFALVDCDPYGIEIAAVIRWGSYKQASISKHTNEASFIQELIVPDLVWLGLLPSEVEDLALPKESQMPLKDREKAKLIKLKDRIKIKGEGDPVWAKEIDLMEKNNVKAELESLYISPQFPAFYFRQKLAIHHKIFELEAKQKNKNIKKEPQ